jgi:ABC-type lipoprotein release transport system permease subunit
MEQLEGLDYDCGSIRRSRSCHNQVFPRCDGLTTYNVASRTAELGIRSALGAQKRDLLSLALRESMMIGTIGCSCGLAASLVATQWIRSLIFGISPSSPVVLGSVVMGLLCATFFAALRPAWRAANVDPMATLRTE